MSCILLLKGSESDSHTRRTQHQVAGKLFLHWVIGWRIKPFNTLITIKYHRF